MGCQICNFKKLDKTYCYDICPKCDWQTEDFLELYFSSKEEALQAISKHNKILDKHIINPRFIDYDDDGNEGSFWCVSVIIPLDKFIEDPDLLNGKSYINKSTPKEFRSLFERVDKIRAFK